MKKQIKSVIVASAVLASSTSFGQLLDEKNITITMDLQPVLQLKLEGPDQHNFTFDEISEYYSGITKYGANILKVSSSVSFDLWAVGLSQTTNFIWDNPMEYQGGGASAVDEIPLTALELRQFPANPAIAAACDPGTGALTVDDNYSSAFAPLDITTNAPAALAVNNSIYTTANTTPYTPPVAAASTAEEKYIAGADDGAAVAGCSVVGGSYLQETLAGGVPSGTGYYYVMDYRLLPGLPAVFPTHEAAANANTTAASLASGAGATTLGGAGIYAAPGVYTMFIKYILVEDQ